MPKFLNLESSCVPVVAVLESLLQESNTYLNTANTPNTANTRISPNRLVSLTDYSKEYNVSRQTLHTWIRAGKINSVKNASGKILVEVSGEGEIIKNNSKNETKPVFPREKNEAVLEKTPYISLIEIEDLLVKHLPNKPNSEVGIKNPSGINTFNVSAKSITLSELFSLAESGLKKITSAGEYGTELLPQADEKLGNIIASFLAGKGILIKYEE